MFGFTPNILLSKTANTGERYPIRDQRTRSATVTSQRRPARRSTKRCDSPAVAEETFAARPACSERATYSFIYYPNSITQATWTYPAQEPTTRTKRRWAESPSRRKSLERMYTAGMSGGARVAMMAA